MSYSSEHYPRVAKPIHFKPHDDLVNDPGYPHAAWPSLERPRQLSLRLHHPDGWKDLPRDYCIVRYPNHTSRRDPKASQDVQLEIFHTDVVKIPDGEIKSKFFLKGNDWTGVTYWNYWYLRGMTRSSVEKIFKKHFGFSIPLYSGSTAGHWMPSPQLYTVEVQENVWEDRLALFFDGNVETSFRSVGQLLREYEKILNAKDLGERFVRIWTSRWEKKGIPDIPLALKGTREKSSNSTNTVPEQTSTETSTSTPKIRGRKRRATLRQLRTGSAKLVRIL
jgi:hypothetical protein